MLKIRRPLGRLIFNMGIAIPGKTVFLIETAPWFLGETNLYHVLWFRSRMECSAICMNVTGCRSVLFNATSEDKIENCWFLGETNCGLMKCTWHCTEIRLYIREDKIENCWFLGETNCGLMKCTWHCTEIRLYIREDKIENCWFLGETNCGLMKCTWHCTEIRLYIREDKIENCWFLGETNCGLMKCTWHCTEIRPYYVYINNGLS